MTKGILRGFLGPLSMMKTQDCSLIEATQQIDDLYTIYLRFVLFCGRI